MRKDYKINGIDFEYATYNEIEREELMKLSRKASTIKNYGDRLSDVLFCEKYNVQRQHKHKSPNYYIEAIKKNIAELEEELNK
ncbi:TPA: hypothetical protein P1J72_003853, partial [Clostridioides difficile]|nr:hypothetical protein [Clostridioides difficile]